ncbi:MAG TPA: hypothetical protein VFH73_21885 [Polyangia bacterium]|nr:hypothetical protein [Polyangia bacterium]
MGFRWFRPLLVFALAHVAASCETTQPLRNDSGSGADGRIQVPSCLRTLFAACLTDGVCHSNTTDGGGPPTRYCFANGVQADYMRIGACEGNGRVVLEVRKPDGALCYTNEVAVGVICESQTFTWKDPSGRVIATGSSDMNATMLHCASGGESVNCPACNFVSVWERQDCEPGCP